MAQACPATASRPHRKLHPRNKGLGGGVPRHLPGSPHSPCPLARAVPHFAAPPRPSHPACPFLLAPPTTPPLALPPLCPPLVAPNAPRPVASPRGHRSRLGQHPGRVGVIVRCRVPPTLPGPRRPWHDPDSLAPSLGPCIGPRVPVRSNPALCALPGGLRWIATPPGPPSMRARLCVAPSMRLLVCTRSIDCVTTGAGFRASIA